MSRSAGAIRGTIHSGDQLKTPTGRGTFEIAEITNDAVVLLFGNQRTPTPLSWSLLDAALEDIAGRGWVPIGASHSVHSALGSFEALLKPAVNRSCANYVAVLLERVGLLEIDRHLPARVRAI